MKCLIAVLACFVAVTYAEDCPDGTATACQITTCNMVKPVCENYKCTCPVVATTVVPDPDVSMITCFDMHDCSGVCDAPTAPTDPHHHPKPHHEEPNHEEPHHPEPHGPGHHHEEHAPHASMEMHCLDGKCTCLQMV